MVRKKVNVHGDGVRSSNEETEWECELHEQFPRGEDSERGNGVADLSSIQRRFIQMRRNAKIQTATGAINDIILQLDHLAQQIHTYATLS
ncbi:BAG family molecular chaperone regulator [Arachis hypogaea]|nr:BAG family molecular chaperone regulator [Arachis hypogaea]